MGLVYYLRNSAAWSTAGNTSTEAVASGLLGIATTTASTGGMLLQGIAYVTGSWTSGAKLYLGSSGAITESLPTVGGQFVRIVGYGIGNNIIYFNPSNDYIEL